MPRARRSRPALALALAGPLGACVSHESVPLAPDAELAALRDVRIEDVRIERIDPAAADGAAPRFDPTDGLDEAELVALALTIHPALRAKRLAIGEADALLVSAGVWPDPSLGAFARPGIGSVSGTALGAEILLTLLRPGERPAKRALARAAIDARRAELVAEEWRVAAAVRRARLDLRAARAASELLREELAIRDETLALVRRQRELGEATELELVLVELDRAAVGRSSREARYTEEHAARELNELLGLPPGAELALVPDEPLAFVLHAPPSEAALDRALLASRPDLRARAAEYDEADAELRLAVARRLPLLALGPSYERDADGGAELGLAAEIELPLLDRRRGEIAARTAARERERAEYAAALHAARAEAFDARAALARAADEVDRLRADLLPLVERVEALFAGAFRAREIDAAAWVSARTRAVDARRDLISALVRYEASVVELEAATGTRITALIAGDESEGTRP